ncbi:MAG TPA: AAA family ATPase [Terriglobia bacterium]|nr:AAA family ATPase [Terriglobia bacterium]
MTTLPLDLSRQSPEAKAFEAGLRLRVVGQDDAIRRLAEVYQVYLAGLAAPGRPLANLLFLGPTGSGKTRLVEAMAEALFGNARAVIKIDCAELQHSHEISKLIGSPPGYLGHRETQPLLTQETLDQHHTEKLKLSLVLFDEIEKASDSLWQLLLGVLDKATLTLGDNRRVDFSRTVIVMTSNLGAREMARLMEGGMGFHSCGCESCEELDAKLERTAIDAARRKFYPEFMNRIDKVMVFRPLGRVELEKVLGIELARIGDRIAASTSGRPFVFQCTPAARDFLLAEGTDPRYGARHLKRTLERHLVFPFANLMATGQIGEGEVLVADHGPLNGHLSFAKRACEALVHVAAA